MKRDVGESPDRNIFSFVSDTVGGVHRRVDDVYRLLRNPTHPKYDSTNFPDNPIPGQVVRDINDLDSLWVYQEDDQAWHQISSGQGNEFPRYFRIHMNTSGFIAAAPYGGLNYFELDWTNYTGVKPVWDTNDTEDGTVINGDIDDAFLDGEVFSFDNTPPFSNRIASKVRGIYAARAIADYQTLAPGPFNFITILGIGGSGVATPQVSTEEISGRIDNLLSIDYTTLYTISGITASDSWTFKFGHSHGTSFKILADFTVVWLGPVRKNVNFVYGL